MDRRVEEQAACQINGSSLERTRSNLDAAGADLLRIAEAEEEAVRPWGQQVLDSVGDPKAQPAET